MMLPHGTAAGGDDSVANRDKLASIGQIPQQQQQAAYYQFTSTRPQLAASPSGSQLGGTSASRWRNLPVSNRLPGGQVEVARSELAPEPYQAQRTGNPPHSPVTGKKRNSISKNLMEPHEMRKRAKTTAKGDVSMIEPPRGTRQSSKDIFHPQSPQSVHQPLDVMPTNPKRQAQIDLSPGEAGYLFGKAPGEIMESQRKGPELSPGHENTAPADPVRFGDSISDPGLLADVHYHTELDRSESSLSAVSSEICHDGNDGNDSDDDPEPEYEYKLEQTKKKISDTMKPLLDIQLGEDQASKQLQNTFKITIVQVLLDWLPSVHSVALDVENNGSPANAHKCLMYAAKTMNSLNQIGKNYGLVDLNYSVDVKLRSENNKVLKEWKNVANYEAYGILMWIWRDLCLSILDNDGLTNDSGGAMVARLLDDIKSSVPLETYDFHEKEEILSFWDLFLTGGDQLIANKGIKALNPTYWSGAFTKAKKRLDHLYCVNRLNELRAYPSVDLYRTVKGILPEKYQLEPLETVKNGCKSSTIEGQIDIFVFECATDCLERLLQDNLLERSSKRFRDVLVTFSSLKKAEAGWARNQMLIGFEEEVKALSDALLREFPNIHVAFTRLSEEENIELGVEDFLETARQGYTGPYQSEAPEVNYRHIFQAYLATVLQWNGGSSNPARESLLKDMKRVFLSKLAIIFEFHRWIGKTLRKGCVIYQAPKLKVALDYFLGDFGFEKILQVEEVTPRVPKGRIGTSESSRISKATVEKRGTVATKRVSRGMAMIKTKSAKRPTNVIAGDQDVEDHN